MVIVPDAPDARHHTGHEEDTGGGGPEAGAKEDLEVAVRAHDVGEEHVAGEEGQQADKEVEEVAPRVGQHLGDKHAREVGPKKARANRPDEAIQ